MGDRLTFGEALVDHPYLLHEVTELRAEIARHHRDFERIQEVLDRTYSNIYGDWRDGPSMRAALQRIRNIVG